MSWEGYISGIKAQVIELENRQVRFILAGKQKAIFSLWSSAKKVISEVYHTEIPPRYEQAY